MAKGRTPASGEGKKLSGYSVLSDKSEPFPRWVGAGVAPRAEALWLPLPETGRWAEDPICSLSRGVSSRQVPEETAELRGIILWPQPHFPPQVSQLSTKFLSSLEEISTCLILLHLDSWGQNHLYFPHRLSLDLGSVRPQPPSCPALTLGLQSLKLSPGRVWEPYRPNLKTRKRAVYSSTR